jgi:hypothetical protein
VVAAEVALDAPAEAVAGAGVAITWTGPNHAGDYITIVPAGTADGRFARYTGTTAGSPLTVQAPMDPGDAEIRYMSGQGGRVLARRPLRVTAAAVTLSAPDEAIAGSAVAVVWSGPGNAGDYITIVPRAFADGRYARYTQTTAGSPLSVTAPLEPGDAELRYMSGQGGKVLARRPLRLVAPVITLEAPAQAPAGSTVQVTWTGPNHAGDYLTIVPKGAAVGTAQRYAFTSRGSPAAVVAPGAAGPAEVRYMSGQGNRVLARVAIELVPPAK